MNSHTKFVRNLICIHGAMSVYSHKKIELLMATEY